MEAKQLRIALGVLVSVLVAGCGSKEESLSQRTGSAVAGAATDFLSGVGEGIDKRMAVELDIDPGLAERGLEVTLGKDRGLGTNAAAVYVIAARSFEGKLMAKALDAEGKEIGRSTMDVAMEADDAQYVNFSFGQEMDSSLVRRYAVSVR